MLPQGCSCVNMKNVIIGTAGHVDHGKTSLIKALTGIDTDRLKEEKERGMSIDIGFAAITLPNGQCASIVDVPGHERFTKNMVAGACGINAALLVIAADDGVMPQTLEHLEILHLLEVKQGVVALTKCDLVEKEWRVEVEADIRQNLKGSFLENATIVAVSNTEGFGLNRLKRELMVVASRCADSPVESPFRMIIDRAFTKTGFGSIVTGTIASGTIREKDTVEVSPSGLQCRVRAIEIHGQRVKQAPAGTRAALNLAAVSLETIKRGDQITPPGLSLTTTRCVVQLKLLPRAQVELKDRTRVRMHAGTAEVIGRLKFMFGQTTLNAGESCYALFTPEVPFATMHKDTMVMRTYSPQTTIGSAVVLDPSPPAQPNKQEDYRLQLTKRIAGSPVDLVTTCLAGSPIGLKLEQLAARSRTTEEVLTDCLNGLKLDGSVIPIGDKYLIHNSCLTALLSRITTVLGDFHERYPQRQGIGREDLRVLVAKGMETREFAILLQLMAARSIIALEGAFVRLREFRIALQPWQQAMLDDIYAEYDKHGIIAPDLAEICTALKLNREALITLLQYGVVIGRFHRPGEAKFITDHPMNSALELVSLRSQTTGGITVGELRDALEVNRKSALQVLEYMDAKKMTRRVHERHVIFSHPLI